MSRSRVAVFFLLFGQAKTKKSPLRGELTHKKSTFHNEFTLKRFHILDLVSDERAQREIFYNLTILQ